MRHQHVLMFLKGVVHPQRDNKVYRIDDITLVYLLKESMLAVDAFTAPDRWTGQVVKRLAILLHRFTIAFHIKLLNMCRQSPQIMAIRNDAVTGRTPKIDVPHT